MHLIDMTSQSITFKAQTEVSHQKKLKDTKKNPK